MQRIGKRDDRQGYKTLRKALEKFPDLDYSKMEENAKKQKARPHGEKPFNEIFQKGTHYSTSLLKNRLIKAGIKTFEKCECCGISEWMGKPIVIQLHHKDGDHTNNEVENIGELCPNCHSQSDSYAKRKTNLKDIGEFDLHPYAPNIQKNIIIKSTKNYCADCGKEISLGALRCHECEVNRVWKNSKRPSKEQLIEEAKPENFISMVEMAKRYGVSDNTIKKWYISYDLPTPKKKLAHYKPKKYAKEYQAYSIRKSATGWERYLHLPQGTICSFASVHSTQETEKFILPYFDKAVKEGIIQYSLD